MIGIIVTGHGFFPKGLMSAVDLIAGPPEGVRIVNFEEGCTSEELKSDLKQAAEKLDTKELVILSDLAGGTPFNMAVLTARELTGHTVEVIAGTNLPMVVEAVFSRELMDFEALVLAVKSAGEDGITTFRQLSAGEGPEFEDGL